MSFSIYSMGISIDREIMKSYFIGIILALTIHSNAYSNCAFIGSKQASLIATSSELVSLCQKYAEEYKVANKSSNTFEKNNKRWLSEARTCDTQNCLKESFGKIISDFKEQTESYKKELGTENIQKVSENEGNMLSILQLFIFSLLIIALAFVPVIGKIIQYLVKPLLYLQGFFIVYGFYTYGASVGSTLLVLFLGYYFLMRRKCSSCLRINSFTLDWSNTKTWLQYNSKQNRTTVNAQAFGVCKYCGQQNDRSRGIKTLKGEWIIDGNGEYTRV